MPLPRLAFKRRAPGRALRSHGATSWAFRRGRARYPPLSAAGRIATTRAVVPARGLVAPGAAARRAALRGRLPDLAAAHRRPRRAHVPRRAVRRGGLHDLERPVVRRPPHARRTASSRRRSPGCSARRLALGGGRGGLGRAVRAARPRLLRRGALALGGDLVRRGHRHAAVHQPAAVRDRRGLRARRAARAAAPPLRAGDRLRRASARSAARSPASSSRWPAWPTRSPPRGDRTKRREGIAIAAAAFIPPVFLAWAFPEGGWAPFPFTAYLPIPLFAIACLVVLPRRESALRWGAALYGAGATLALFLDTQMGGNAVRLGALFGGPVLLCAVWGQPLDAPVWALPLLACRLRGARLLAVVARRARRDQVHRGPGRQVRLLRAAAPVPGHAARPAPHRDPVHAQPLGGRRGRARDARSPAAGCASSTPGATRSSTAVRSTSLTYASWLAENAVRYVALPSAKPDKSSYARARADRARPALPAAALALRRLARVRGHCCPRRS